MVGAKNSFASLLALASVASAAASPLVHDVDTVPRLIQRRTPSRRDLDTTFACDFTGTLGDMVHTLSSWPVVAPDALTLAWTVYIRIPRMRCSKVVQCMAGLSDERHHIM